MSKLKKKNTLDEEEVARRDWSKLRKHTLLEIMVTPAIELRVFRYGNTEMERV